MNLVECWIKEIHNVTESKDYPDMLIVDLTYNCYGSIRRTNHYTTRSEWEKEQNQGYFLG